ncbi:MAG TPA: hypothetical protein VK711_02320 [Puia sp.]|jgi:hypothetical protein|nr:hypothetical protein [Puia sp.]
MKTDIQFDGTVIVLFAFPTSRNSFHTDKKSPSARSEGLNYS